MEIVKYLIEDIASISAGGDKPQRCSNTKTDIMSVPVYSNGLENRGLYGYTDTPKIEGDTVTVSARGVNIGTVCYREIPYVPIVRLLSLIPKRNIIDAKYLYYALKNTVLIGTGSAQPQITVPMISKQEVYVHKNLEDQIKISSVLSDIDRKIVLNQKINENLLQQARALFHRWFTGASSAMYKLSDVADINPETYSPKDNWGFVNYLDTSSITAGTITEVQYILPSEEKLPSRARRILRKGDVVFSTVRPNQLHYGIISNPKPNMLGSTGFAVIRSKFATIPNEIIYLALTETSFVEQMQQLAEQSVSTFPSIRPADLDTCVLPEPKEEDNDFLAAIKAIFNTVATNDEENQRLATLRDTLLPLLMSGELDASVLDI